MVISPIPSLTPVPICPSVIVPDELILTVSLLCPSIPATVTVPVESISRSTPLESNTSPVANCRVLAAITKSTSPVPAGLVSLILSPAFVVNVVVPFGL